MLICLVFICYKMQFIFDLNKDKKKFLKINYLASSSPVWFFIRREPFYHKLQYSKTPKYDPMAAFLGAALGAFVVYLSLSTFGTNGTDLSDLTVLLWYFFLILFLLKLTIQIITNSFYMGINFILIFFYIMVFFFYILFFFLKNFCKKLINCFFN